MTPGCTHQRFLLIRSLPNRRLTPSCSAQSHPYCPCRHPRGAGHRCAAFGVAVQQAHSWAGFLGAFIFERLRFWCQPAGARAHALGALLWWWPRQALQWRRIAAFWAAAPTWGCGCHTMDMQRQRLLRWWHWRCISPWGIPIRQRALCFRVWWVGCTSCSQRSPWRGVASTRYPPVIFLRPWWVFMAHFCCSGRRCLV